MIRHQYRFTYDFSNRLLTANHFTHNGAIWVNTNNYSENNIVYDFNGNIKTYNRRGQMPDLSFNVIDNLTYTYGDAARPDRLTNMVDAGDAAKGFKYTVGAAAYQYDLNGNMTQDNHKGFTFAYNYLNLPQTMTKGVDVITMTYTADGEKLTKALSGGGATKSYVSGIEYSGVNLDAVYFSEGRCVPNGATAFHYDYTIKDHLGNARENFRANGAAVTHIEDMHYYPFGMLMEMGTASPANDYTYNGKELNEDFSLNLHDYGARWYDAALGRWWSVDPMGPKAANYSPYTYVYNNPMSFIDPTGMFAIGRGEDTDAWATLKVEAEKSEKRSALKEAVNRALSGNQNVRVNVDDNGGVAGVMTNGGLEDEQGGGRSYKQFAESLNKADPALYATLATSYDPGLEEEGGPLDYVDLGAYDEDIPHLNSFAKAVVADQSGSGTIKIWIDPYNYQRSKKIVSFKGVPQVLVDESRRSGVQLNNGIINAYNQVINAFESNGINLGASKSNFRVEVWLKKSLSTGQVPKGKRTEHSNTVIWIRPKV